MGEENHIMYASKEAASVQTLTGWVSACGRYWGKDEHMARWSGATHKVCECGNIHEKIYTKCATCRSKREAEIYAAMTHEKYEGQPVTLFLGYEYFWEESEIRDHCHYTSTDINDLQLVVCEPEYVREVDYEDFYCDDLPEDCCFADVAPEIAKKFDELNKFIREQSKIICWRAGGKRTSLKSEAA